MLGAVNTRQVPVRSVESSTNSSKIIRKKCSSKDKLMRGTSRLERLAALGIILGSVC